MSETEPRPPLPVIEPLSEADLTALARDVVTNVIYLVNDPYKIDLSFGFMMTMIVSQSEFTEEEFSAWADTVGAVYAPYDEAAPRSVNGLPMFFSCKLLHFEDVPRLIDAMKPMCEALGIPFEDDQEPAQPGEDPYTEDANVEVAEALDAVKRKVGDDE